MFNFTLSEYIYILFHLILYSQSDFYSKKKVVLDKKKYAKSRLCKTFFEIHLNILYYDENILCMFRSSYVNLENVCILKTYHSCAQNIMRVKN